MVSEMKTHFEAGVITVQPEDAKDMFYQHVDDATTAKFGTGLLSQSLGSYRSTTTYAAWRYIPTT